MAERPIRIIGNADGPAHRGRVRPGHRAVVVLDLDLTATYRVIATMDEIAVLGAIGSR